MQSAAAAEWIPNKKKKYIVANTAWLNQIISLWCIIIKRYQIQYVIIYIYGFISNEIV